MKKTKSSISERQSHRSDELDPASGNEVILREQLISKAAYFRAAQRRFAPGNEMPNWLDAEFDV